MITLHMKTPSDLLDNETEMLRVDGGRRIRRGVEEGRLTTQANDLELAQVGCRVLARDAAEFRIEIRSQQSLRTLLLHVVT